MPRLKPVMRALFLAGVLLALAVIPTLSADGDLDLTFDSDGKVTTTFGDLNALAYAVAVQDDGKIVVAGYTGTGDWYLGTNRYLDLGSTNLALARFNSDGSLDATFGNGGKVTTSLGANSTAVATSIAIQPDGKIVVAGYVYIVAQGNFTLLARYNSDGSLDTTFGNGGTILHQFVQTCPFDSRGYALILLPDGKFVVAGRGVPGGKYFTALMRFNADGSKDTTFGTSEGGLTLKSVTNASGTVDAQIFAVARLPDEGFIGAGYAESRADSSGSADFLLVRYTGEGALDTTFGSGGIVTTDLNTNSNDKAYGVAVQPDGKIVVAGFSGSYFALARYNEDGSLDATFGSGGIAISTLSNSEAEAVRILSNGQILLTGFAALSGGGDGSRTFIVARYNSDGSPDANFGNGGVVRAKPGLTQAEGFAMAFQPADNKLLVAGATNASKGFAVARFLNSRAPYTGTLPSTVTATVTITGGGTLALADRRVTVQFPAGAVTATTLITYTYRAPLETGDLHGIDRFFGLEAAPPVARFRKPVTIRVTYPANNPLIEDSIRLYWLSNTTWLTGGITTTARTSTSLTSLTNHFTLFAVLGKTHSIYLPLLLK
ncbi:MAG: hypothetical protein D6796_11025 [Caldilineae bacterium]|nr:MAG: hypothetical protein D6796_11025 [Caldilineae bacterium]